MDKRKNTNGVDDAGNGASQQRLAVAIDGVADRVVMFDSEDRLMLANKSWWDEQKSFGLTLNIGDRYRDFAHGLAASGRIVGAAGDEDEWVKLRLERRRKPGEGMVVRTTEGEVVLVRDHNLPDGSTLTITTTITEQVRAEAALEASEQRFRNLAEHSIQGIMVHRDDKPLFANFAFADILGYEDPDDVLKMTTLDEFKVPEDRERMRRYREDRMRGLPAPDSYEFEAVRKDGRRIWLATSHTKVDWDGAPAIQSIVYDITERKQAEAALRVSEEQLHQAQKMEAVGQLTGGVAHDFNNLLTVIMGNLEMLSERLEGDDSAQRYTDHALANVERGATLTDRLLAFSRKQALMPRVIDANDLVRGMTNLLRRTLEESVEIELMSSDDLWRCKADPGQVENALLNLAINARDAMSGNGKLTIETANVELDDVYAAAQAEVVPGPYVMFAVTDTGTGIPRADIDKVFEPFFTTKASGKGSGLGLSMVYGFVKQSGGHVTIYSEQGVGTTVKVYLPRSDPLSEGAAGITRRIDQIESPEARGETILVVEDDTDVRTLAVALLRDLGYEILEAADAESALRILGTSSRINLLFTDVILPGGINGPELAAEVRRRRPEIGVLYASGYTENAIIHQGRFDESLELLKKPYKKSHLARKIRAVLDEAKML